MNASPTFERHPIDQKVADRHPEIPQEALMPAPAAPDLEPCGACGASTGEACRPWCIGQAAQLDLFAAGLS